MNLYFSSDQPDALTRLLAKADSLLAVRPDLRMPAANGGFKLEVPLPHGYKPRWLFDATRMRVFASASGWIWSYDEAKNGGSGGAIGSCIASRDLVRFFTSWLAANQGEPQLDLFGVAA